MCKNHVRVRVGVIVETLMGYPLMFRQGSHSANTWCWPGGHLEFQESILVCAARETQEELGIVVDKLEILPWVTEDFFEKEQKHYITLFVKAHSVQIPRIMEPDKCVELSYVSTDCENLQLFFDSQQKFMSGVCESWHNYRKYLNIP